MNDSDAYLPPWEGPAILLVDLDAFFASVEQLDHPAWRGKPVIVGGDADAHGVVSTCSYEARAFGVRSAMASSLARALCPEAIWTHGHFHRYREVSAAIMAILRDETPHVQQVSIDEAFMDVTPTAVNTEHPVLVAQRIQERVAALGVTCSIGVGTSKSVAKIASDRDKPRGLTVVFPGTEAAFLEKLPVRTLSGVGAAAERTLLSHGVRTLGAMGRADGALLRKIFGKNGEMMRDRALGRDRSEVAEDDEVKSVSNEVTYAHDLETREDIEAALSTISAKVGRRLRRKGLKGRTVAVKMRYDNRTTRSAQCALAVPTDDDHRVRPGGAPPGGGAVGSGHEGAPARCGRDPFRGGRRPGAGDALRHCRPRRRRPRERGPKRGAHPRRGEAPQPSGPPPTLCRSASATAPCASASSCANPATPPAPPPKNVEDYK